MEIYKYRWKYIWGSDCVISLKKSHGVCAITVKAKNFEYKTGGNEVQLRVNGGNFDVTQIIPVTPAEKYKGKTLEFFVGLTAHKDSVIYAKVGW